MNALTIALVLVGAYLLLNRSGGGGAGLTSFLPTGAAQPHPMPPTPLPAVLPSVVPPSPLPPVTVPQPAPTVVSSSLMSGGGTLSNGTVVAAGQWAGFTGHLGPGNVPVTFADGIAAVLAGKITLSYWHYLLNVPANAPINTIPGPGSIYDPNFSGQDWNDLVVSKGGWLPDLPAGQHYGGLPGKALLYSGGGAAGMGPAYVPGQGPSLDPASAGLTFTDASGTYTSQLGADNVPRWFRTA